MIRRLIRKLLLWAFPELSTKYVRMDELMELSCSLQDSARAQTMANLDRWRRIEFELFRLANHGMSTAEMAKASSSLALTVSRKLDELTTGSSNVELGRRLARMELLLLSPTSDGTTFVEVDGGRS